MGDPTGGGPWTLPKSGPDTTSYNVSVNVSIPNINSFCYRVKSLMRHKNFPNLRDLGAVFGSPDFRGGSFCTFSTLAMQILADNDNNKINKLCGHWVRPTRYVPARVQEHVTSLPWPLTLEVMALPVMRLFVLQLCTKFEVRRPSNLVDMTHFVSQH